MIRRLVPGDADIFRRIRLEALRLEPAAFASRTEDWEVLDDAGWEQRLTANAVFVSFERDDPVGIMGLRPQTSSKMAHRASVIMVYVRASCRRIGYASALLDALTVYARDNGLRQLELAVSVEIPGAVKFYERSGFDHVGRIPAGFIHEGRGIDELLMVKRLNA